MQAVKLQAQTYPDMAALFGLILVPWLGVIALGGLTPVLADISKHFASTPGADTLVRMLVTVAGGASVVGSLAAGFLADKLGNRRLLMLALALFAVTGTAGYFLDNIWLMLATRFFVGIGFGLALAPAVALLTLFVPEENRNRWLGFLALSGAVGGVALILLAGVIGKIDWRLPFLLHLLALVMLLLVIILVPQPATRESSAGHEAAKAEQDTQPSFKFPLAVFMMGIACGAAVNVAGIYLPFLFARIGIGGSDKVAMALVASTVAAAITSATFGWIRKRISLAQAFVLAFCLIGAGLAIVGTAKSLGVILVGQAFAGLAVGIFSSNLMAYAGNAAPLQRTRRVGAARGGYMGVTLLVQVLLEPVVRVYGPAGAVLTIAGFAAIMALVSLRGRSGFLTR
jgi:MFS family permease